MLDKGNIHHWDIKPDNFLIAGQIGSWDVKIIDFGVAQHFGGTDGSVFRHWGTPLYAAPELFDRETGKQWNEEVAKATDIFSLGLRCFGCE